MDQEFWTKIETASHFDVLGAGEAKLRMILSSEGSERDSESQRDAVVGALESGGFKVISYLPMPDCVKWSPSPEPAFGLFLPEDPSSLLDVVAADYRARKASIQERLSKLPVTGATEFNSFPYGWLSLAEVIVEGFERACAQYPDGKIKVMQIKEKFGALRVYLLSEGPEEFQTLAYSAVRWADTASHIRCSVTGRLGKIVGPGWYLCLSKEAEYWRDNHRYVFQRLIYPD